MNENRKFRFLPRQTFIDFVKEQPDDAPINMLESRMVNRLGNRFAADTCGCLLIQFARKMGIADSINPTRVACAGYDSIGNDAEVLQIGGNAEGDRQVSSYIDHCLTTNIHSFRQAKELLPKFFVECKVDNKH